jgi:hypothetical protein
MIAIFQARLRCAELYIFEQMLSVNSIAMLICLYTLKPPFVPGRGALGLLAAIAPYWVWEMVIGLAAVLKPMGLALCLAYEGSVTGFALRILGLVGSSFWLSNLAVSLALYGGSATAIAVAPLVMLALGAFWIMFRSLPMPANHG